MITTQTQLWWGRLVDGLTTELTLYMAVGSIKDFSIQTQLLHSHIIDVQIHVREVILHFAILPNTLAGVYEKIEYGERTATGYAWSVLESVAPEELCWEIFSCIADREEEKVSEMFCLERIRSYGYTKAIIATFEEDMRGIDIQVPYKGILVPLQLKQAAKGQFEHKKHYPHIPSLVYSNYQCNAHVEKRCLEMILEDYMRGIVTHLNVHTLNL
jgi:hypothetical protein